MRGSGRARTSTRTSAPRAPISRPSSLGSASIICAALYHAGESIGELCLALTAKVGLGAIARTIHPYPTQAEAIRKAADAWRRTKLTPTAKRAFGLWFRLTR